MSVGIGIQITFSTLVWLMIDTGPFYKIGGFMFTFLKEENTENSLFNKITKFILR